MLRLTPLRIIRLCLKEHRESLRDRRTIVTLFLMPLLVYPLLSLLLNRALLTSFLSNDQEVNVTIGISAELAKTPLATMLALGWGLMQEDDRQSQRPPERAAESASVDKSGPQIVFLDDDGRLSLRNGSVDLVIVRKVNEDDEELSAGSAPLRQMIRQYASLFRGTAGTDIDVEAVLDSLGAYEVQYRKGDVRSQQALSMVERLVMRLNQEAVTAFLGGRFDPPVRIVATPVESKGNFNDLLATLVPLVLVLMTMAGAVYPAIDLTAGERERGTMEALVVSPMPTPVILLTKYSAVVTVAILTALANLSAMTLTLWVSGIGAMVFDEGVFSRGMIGTVLALLILFTMFFAALVMAITSFAKSFKEAQAYLIPLTLLALTPGVMSLLPGIRFTPFLATLPLVNIVLLAREILAGEAQWESAVLAVICTCIYAVAALAVASRVFGSSASLHGSQGSWSDLLVRPRTRRPVPGVDQMALTMAFMFPMYFIASSSLPYLSGSLQQRLMWSSVISYALLVGIPVLLCWYRRIDLVETLMLRPRFSRRWWVWLPAIMLAAGSMWMFAHELVILAQEFGFATIMPDQMEEVSEFRQELAQVPLSVVLFALAITPALSEEFLFRGFVLSALRRSPIGAIVGSAVAFGLMHVLTSNVLAVERFLPTTYIGLVLGYIALRTGSIWPGLLLHATHNALLLLLARYQETVEDWGVLVNQTQHLPGTWLLGGGLALVFSLVLIYLSTRPPVNKSHRTGIPEPSGEDLASQGLDQT